MASSNLFLQPSFNIGMIGSVANGKSTMVKTFTGIETFKHSKEQETGKTIKLGYANCKIFKCNNCPKPVCYQYTGSRDKTYNCINCGTECELVKFFSFVDCPGHDSLMSTMLSGATIMDYALVMIDATQKFPDSQPQTVEHLQALEILQVKQAIIIQNKLDLVDGNKAQEQCEHIREFIKGTCVENAPIIPVSAQKKYNLDILAEYITELFQEPVRIHNPPKMLVVRSFDVNKPGFDIQNIIGGVVGGSLVSGNLKVGDEVEIRPGIIDKTSTSSCTWKPLRAIITSMKSDTDQLTTAGPGGLIAVCTDLDPCLTKSDKMIGQIIGIPDQMPPVYTEINANCMFIMKTIGASTIKITKPKKK